MSEERTRLLGTATLLLLLTAVYNLGEAVIGFWTALRDGSLSLEAFALDSLIEIALALVVWWRVRKELQGATEAEVERVERQTNKVAAIAFAALSIFILLQSIDALLKSERSSPSFLAIGIALLSLIIMPILARKKRSIGKQLDERSLVAEAACTMVCAYMSLTLLIGLLATRFLGWWWADPVASLGILYFIYGEMRESWERSKGIVCSCGDD